VLVAAGDGLGVIVASAVAVAVGTGLAVAVSVNVEVAVGISVLVATGVAVGPPVDKTTSWGGFVPSRELKSTPSVDCATRPRQIAPLPDTKADTLYSSQTPDVIRPLSSCGLATTGLVAHVIPVSAHVVL